MNKIAVIDYGMGNLHSVAKALEHVGAQLGQQIEVVPLPLRHPQSSARSPDLPKSEKIKCFTVPQRVA